MGIFYNPRIVTDGLVLYLDAGNRRSYPATGTLWTDLSGQGNNGTLINSPTFNTGNLGNLSIPVGAKIDVNATNLKTNSGTWSIWLRSSDTINNFLEFMSLATPDVQLSDGIHLYISTGISAIAIKSGINFIINAQINNNTSDNKWHNIVMTYQTNVNCSVYFDGQQVFSSSLTNWNWTSSNTLRICGKLTTWSEGDDFTGNVSNVSIYNRAITIQEVSQNFNAIRGRYGI